MQCKISISDIKSNYWIVVCAWPEYRITGCKSLSQFAVQFTLNIADYVAVAIETSQYRCALLQLNCKSTFKRASNYYQTETLFNFLIFSAWIKSVAIIFKRMIRITFSTFEYLLLSIFSWCYCSDGTHSWKYNINTWLKNILCARPVFGTSDKSGILKIRDNLPDISPLPGIRLWQSSLCNLLQRGP